MLSENLYGFVNLSLNCFTYLQGVKLLVKRNEDAISSWKIDSTFK